MAKYQSITDRDGHIIEVGASDTYGPAYAQVKIKSPEDSEIVDLDIVEVRQLRDQLNTILDDWGDEPAEAEVAPTLNDLAIRQVALDQAVRFVSSGHAMNGTSTADIAKAFETFLRGEA